jgi:hypothetical protein
MFLVDRGQRHAQSQCVQTRLVHWHQAEWNFQNFQNLQASTLSHASELDKFVKPVN